MLPLVGQSDSAIEVANDYAEVQGVQVPGGGPHRGELAQAEDALQEVEAQFGKQGGAPIVAADAIKSAQTELVAPDAPKFSK